MHFQQLQLNNLQEIYFPIDSPYISTTCHIPIPKTKPEDEIFVEIEVSFPFTSLLQKVEFDLNEQFSHEDFASVFLLKQICSDSRPLEMLQSSGGGSQITKLFGGNYLDNELEQLRSQVLGVNEASSENESSDLKKQIFKVCTVTKKVSLLMNVVETFGVDLTSAKELKNKELQEDLRSLSRLQESDSEVNVSHEDIEGMVRRSFAKKKDDQQQQTVEKIFKRAFHQIVQGLKVYGWPCFRIPAANNLIPLLNCSFYLQQKAGPDSPCKAEVEFLTALALMNGRKFIQATEQFRKLQKRLLPASSQESLSKVVQLEILIADSMNQHSQMFEKMNSLQRVVDLYLRREVKATDMPPAAAHIKEEEIYKMLMKMHPHLLKVLLLYVDSNIEAVKLSVLRLLEFLIDTLGCSLDNYLISILNTIIATYPKQSSQTLASASHYRSSFFDCPSSDSYLAQLVLVIEQKQEAWQYLSRDNCISEFQEGVLRIREGQQLQQQYLQSIKNLQNHILETFLSLLSSTASNLLIQIFNRVIQKNIFIGQNPFQNQLAADLRIYLLKFSDKIVSICQGDIVLAPSMLDSIVESMLPSHPPSSKDPVAQLGDTSKAKFKAQHETISLACQNLWQTLRQKLFLNYQSKHLKQLVEWLAKALGQVQAQLAGKHSEAEISQKLTLLFDVVELLATSLHQGSRDQTQLIWPKLPRMAVLELATLIKPTLHWMDFSLERKDRLGLFKVIWKALIKIVQVLPAKELQIDLQTILVPILTKVNEYCKCSQPSQEMLQFLQLVLAEFQGHKLHKQLSCLLQELLTTLSKCIPHHLHDEIFSVCELLLELMTKGEQQKQPNSLSHNKSAVDRGQALLGKEHIQCLIQALIDRYTMRSKAHKKLISEFIKITLDLSQQDLQRQLLEEVQNQEAMQNNGARGGDLSGHSLNMQSPDNFRFQQHRFFHDENYEYEGESMEESLDDSQQDILNEEFDGNQRNANESPSSQRVVLRNQLANVRRNPEFRGEQEETMLRGSEMFRQTVGLREPNFYQQIQTFFDYFCDECFFQNNYNSKDQYSNEIYFEKLQLFVQLLKSLDQSHIQLFQKLLEKDQLTSCLLAIFSNEKSTSQCFEILETLSTFYMSNCAPKNLYEHPAHLLTPHLFASPVQNNNFQHFSNNNNNNQNSSGSQYQRQFSHQNNRESSRTSYMSQQQQNNNNQLRNQPVSAINFANSQQIPTAQLFPHQFQNRQQQQQQELDDDLLEGINQQLEAGMVKDEVDIINRERLVLIKIYVSLIKLSIEYLYKYPDSYLQFSTLILIENLFANLMPVPSFQNQLIKKQLVALGGGGDPQYPREDPLGQTQRTDHARLSQFEIPNFEKIVIVGSLQEYQQAMEHLNAAMRQSQGLNSTSQYEMSRPHPILAEFECSDPKYLHGRLQFALKIWSFLEQSFFQSSWSNIKSLSYGIMCHIMKVELKDYKSSFQSKVKKCLLPLVSSLVTSKENEAKAGGLNVLGAFCGLSHDFSLLADFKLAENLTQFRKNSHFVSLAIWQQVFNLQDDWDQAIRDAAAVLVQLCAPRDSTLHFYKIAKEQFKFKLASLASKMENRAETEQNEIAESMLNYSSPFNQTTSYHNTQNQPFQTNEDEDEEEEKNSFENVSEQDSFVEYFYVDLYSDSQLKEILAIFKSLIHQFSLASKNQSVLDFKQDSHFAPKLLWIEKGLLESHPAPPYSESLAKEEGPNALDQFEDTIVSKMNTKLQGGQDAGGSQDLAENLIFERHFDLLEGSGKEKVEESKEVFEEGVGVPGDNEDLGIIDLDSDDVMDEFDELDDEKLPVLKNTYSKKSRPNNSKSMAIGSRSQGGEIKYRTADQKQTSSEEEKAKDSELDNSTELKEDLMSKTPTVAQEMQPTLTVKQKMNLSMSKEQIQKSIELFRESVESSPVKEEEPKPPLPSSSSSGKKGQSEEEKEKMIAQYEELIQQNLRNLSEQIELQMEEMKTPKQAKEEKQERPPQTATLRLNKKLEEQLLDRSRQREKKSLNKSSEVIFGSGGLGKHRIQHTFSPPSVHEKDLQFLGSTLYPNVGNIKKINDPLQNYKSTSYSSQANLKQKSANAYRKNEGLSKSNFTSTQPGSTQFNFMKATGYSKQSYGQSKTHLTSPGTKFSLASALQGPVADHQVSYNSQQITRKKKNSVKRSEGQTSMLLQKTKGQVKSGAYHTQGEIRAKNSNQLSPSSHNMSLEKNLAPKHPINVVKRVDQNLMNQAKQAFVSRAKSQSYLNNVTTVGSNSSLSAQSRVAYSKKAGLRQNKTKQEASSFLVQAQSNSFGAIQQQSNYANLSGSKQNKSMQKRPQRNSKHELDFNLKKSNNNYFLKQQDLRDQKKKEQDSQPQKHNFRAVSEDKSQNQLLEEEAMQRATNADTLGANEKKTTTVENDYLEDEDDVENFIKEDDEGFIEGLDDQSEEKLGRTYKQLSSIDEEDEELKSVLKLQASDY